MIRLNSKVLRENDTVQFRSLGKAVVKTIGERRSDMLPVVLTFEGADAKSHYATDGRALPSRGRSIHDIIDIISAARPLTALNAGDRVTYRGSAVLFLGLVAGTQMATIATGKNYSGQYSGVSVVNQSDLTA